MVVKHARLFLHQIDEKALLTRITEVKNRCAVYSVQFLPFHGVTC